MSGALRIAFSALGLLGTGVTAWLMFRRCLAPLRAAHAGYEPVSLQFCYTPDTLAQSLSVLDAHERMLLSRYWRLGLCLAVFGWAAMLAATRNTAVIPAVCYGMYSAATLAMLFQLAEKALLRRILRSPSAHTSQMASLLTVAKWVALGLWVAGLFAGLLLRAWQL